ncbi:hypothetical protein [Leucobacter luti]|uniref:hypothetical protein n=1 Tax=Leucobacter luti TaxID=340320 RepID=UPI003D00F812
MFDDLDAARAAAHGEAVERSCGNILGTLPVQHASWAQMSRRGLGRVLNGLIPADLPYLSLQQGVHLRTPFTPEFSACKRWISGTSNSSRNCLTEAGLVFAAR